MKDLIAKFRALPVKSRALLVALLAFATVTGGDYAFRTRPAALNAGRPVIIEQQHGAPGKVGATGDNPQGVTITGAGMNLAGLKLLSVATGTAGTDGANVAQIAATTLNSFAAPTGTVSMSNQLLASVADPVSVQDAVNLRSMNAVAHPATDAACLVNVASLSGTGVSCDGIAMSTAGVSRPLLTAQSTASQNGPWIVQSGAWTRPSDFPAAAHAYGSAFRAVQGSTKAASTWLVTTTLAAGDVVGTNNLTLVQTNAGGGSSFPLSGNVSAATFQINSLGDPTAAQDAVTRSYVDARVIIADVATTTAVAAYTYANGSSGVGATITFNANGACAAVDGVTPTIGPPATHILFLHGVAASDNGLYFVSQTGTGGTPCIWTRSTRMDQAAEFVGAKIRITSGVQHIGHEYTYIAQGTVTPGTTGLYFLNLGTGSPNEVFRIFSDFAEGDYTAAKTAGVFPGIVALTGTNAAVAVGALNDSKTLGVLDCNIGSATNSRCAVTGSPNGTMNEVSSFAMATANALYLDLRVQVNPLSSGTEIYNFWFGLADGIATFPPANMIGGMYQQSGTGNDTHWQSAFCAASTCTRVASANTVTAATFVRFTLRKDAGDTSYCTYFDGVSNGCNTANIPSGFMAPMMAGLRAASTTATQDHWKVDWYTGIYTIPGGRG